MRHFSRRWLLLLATAACGGSAWFSVHVYHGLRLADDVDERALVRATLQELPERNGADIAVVVEYQDARATAAAALSAGEWRRARLTWHGAPLLHVGETWQLLVALSAPRSMDNPGGLNTAIVALRDRIHAQLRVQPSRLNRRLRTAPGGIDAMRERIAAQLHARLPERDSAALAAALAIGDTRSVSAEQWRVYNATGITHLIAISGTHVTLFCLLMSALARRLWQQCAALQRFGREGFAGACGVLASTGYALLSGFSVPTQRTLIMLAVWHLLRGLARNSGAVSAIAVAAVLVLMLDPLAPLSAGFWLSFVAVAVLIHATPACSGGELNLRALWQTQWRVAVGLLPVTLAVFGSVSLAGLVVNFLAIPVFSFVLVPLLLGATVALAVCPPLAGALLALFSIVHGWLWPWLVAAANWPLALWRLHPAPWWYVLAVPAAMLWLLPWRWPLRAAALLALAPAIWPQALVLRDGEFRLTVLDVGRSLAVVLQTRSHALLYDNGESWGSSGAITRSAVIPSLRALGVRQLELVMVPRLDDDHAAGLVALAAELPIATLLTASADLPPEFSPCSADQSWSWDSVHISTVVADGCALRISAPGGPAVLLPGESAAAVLAERLRADQAPTEVVIVARGGAASADSPALRAMLGARYAIVSNSRRGLATRTVQATLAAWRAAGVTTLSTAATGAVEVKGGAAPLQLHTRR